MADFREKDYRVFEMFEKDWALVTAGTPEHFNSCTLGWGSFGSIWSGRDGGPVITIYVHPSRYTCSFLQESGTFTICFFPPSCKKALAFFGTNSGRDVDKAQATGLTPVPCGESVAYAEANLTFLCKKLYQHQFAREDLAPEVRDYYAANPDYYTDFHGGWQPHMVFLGKIIDVQDRRSGGEYHGAIQKEENRNTLL